MKRSLVAMLGVIPVVALASSAGAFSWYQAGGQDVVWAGGQSVRALSPITFPPGSETETLIFGAMGLWNIVPSTAFEYQYAPLSQEIPFDIDGINNTAAVPTADLDPGVLGVTFLVNSGAQWVDMDIAFADVPDNIGWNFETNPDCVSLSDPVSHGYNFLMVAAHELGHGLGLGHEPIGNEAPGTPWFIATMNPRYPSGGAVGSGNIVELWADDRAGLRYLYPPSGPSQPAYRDLANAGYTWGLEIGKALPVAFSPVSAPPGGLFTADAGIQNFGNRSHLFIDMAFYLSTDETISGDDINLGVLEFDVAFEDALDFDVDVELPDDLAAGDYFLISRIDDADEIAEVYEDNNEVIYCSTFEVERLAPSFATLGQETVPAGVPYFGPTPVLAKPLNMAPTTWSLDNPAPGMTINPSTGVISWPSPIEAPFLYALTVRATNSAGTSTGFFFLGVTAPPPTCDADLDGDGDTDVFDFNIFAPAFGTSLGQPGFVPAADLNNDNVIDVFDFNIFAPDFGCTP